MMVQRMSGDPDLCGVSFAAALELLAPYALPILICCEARRDVAKYIEREYRLGSRLCWRPVRHGLACLSQREVRLMPPVILSDEMMVNPYVWAVADGLKVIYSIPEAMGLNPPRGWLLEVLG
jgi:hypothetical protein